MITIIQGGVVHEVVALEGMHALRCWPMRRVSLTRLTQLSDSLPHADGIVDCMACVSAFERRGLPIVIRAEGVVHLTVGLSARCGAVLQRGNFAYHGVADCMTCLVMESRR